MPEWKDEIRKRLAHLELEPGRECEIVEELCAHLEERYRELLAGGATPDKAERGARAELEGSDRLARELGQLVAPVPSERQVVGAPARFSLISDLYHDVRYGARVLRKNRGFALIAILTMALGIGANTAIFSVVYAVMLRALPFPGAERLMVLAERTRTGEETTVAYPNYQDWRARAQSFEEMACFGSNIINLTGLERPLRVAGRRVSWNFLPMLTPQLQLGRHFTPEDDRAGAPPTAIISSSMWRENFAAAADIVGRAITINGEPHTVIGVLPPGFEFIRKCDIYTPFGLALTAQSGLLDRGNHFSLFALARLRPGVGIAQAQQEMNGIAKQLEQDYPNTNSGQGALVQRLDEQMAEYIRPALLVLLAAVAFVLLIAVANIANLMMVRAAYRQREFAIRLSLGASRARIVRQLLCESLLVAILGGLAGLVLAIWLNRALLLLAPPSIPRLTEAHIDYRMLLFALALSVVTGLLFGLVPAWQATRADLNTLMRESGLTVTGSSRESLRRVLVGAEVALAFVLLVGAGLMLRTMWQLMNVDAGFNRENILTMRFNLPPKPYDKARRRQFYNECIARVEAVPGVRAAALTLSLPTEGSNWGSVFIVADKPVPARAEIPSAAFTPVSINYFSMMEIKLLKGRLFGPGDGAQAGAVVVINETMARRFWPNEDAIGKRIKQGWPESETPWREIVGVVADVKLNGLTAETPLNIYLPLEQEPPGFANLVVRTEQNPLALGQAVEQAIHTLDKDLPVYDIRSMDQALGNTIAQQRLLMILLAAFALLALVLSALGIYGVISYSVSQRRQEIGIRIALGAQYQDVLRLILGQGLALTLAGLLAGIAAALALTRLMQGLLFGVSATDPATFVLIAMILALVALAAGFIPARRATRIDPVTTLKY